MGWTAVSAIWPSFSPCDPPCPLSLMPLWNHLHMALAVLFFIEVIFIIMTTINPVFSWTRMTFLLSLIKLLQVESRLNSFSSSVYLWLSTECIIALELRIPIHAVFCSQVEECPMWTCKHIKVTLAYLYFRFHRYVMFQGWYRYWWLVIREANNQYL